MKAVADIQTLLPEHITLDPKVVLELIKEFASTWVSLNAYDKEALKIIGTTKKAVRITGEELFKAIQNLRTELIKKGEAKLNYLLRKENRVALKASQGMLCNHLVVRRFIQV